LRLDPLVPDVPPITRPYPVICIAYASQGLRRLESGPDVLTFKISNFKGLKPYIGIFSAFRVLKVEAKFYRHNDFDTYLGKDLEFVPADSNSDEEGMHFLQTWTGVKSSTLKSDDDAYGRTYIPVSDSPCVEMPTLIGNGREKEIKEKYYTSFDTDWGGLWFDTTSSARWYYDLNILVEFARFF